VSEGRLAFARASVIENREPGDPGERRSSILHAHDPGAIYSQRTCRTTPETDRTIRPPREDLPRKAADTKYDREPKKYADNRDERLYSRGRDQLESHREPPMAPYGRPLTPKITRPTPVNLEDDFCDRVVRARLRAGRRH
jgi:hypothetical protein